MKFVIVLNSDKIRRAQNLCSLLIDRGIGFRYEKLESQHTIKVLLKDVAALVELREEVSRSETITQRITPSIEWPYGHESA